MFIGKMKAFTLSYDDGIAQDIRFTELLKEYGLKCTFNLNSGIMTSESRWEDNGVKIHRMTREDMGDIYEGHEIAMHFLTHPNPIELDDNALEKEIGEDIANLEKLFSCKVRGGAYPYGCYDERVMKKLSDNGIGYCRTTGSTGGFSLPKKPLMLEATCHHNDGRLMTLGKQFVEMTPEEPQLFYLWGHTYEFDVNKSWDMIRRFFELISGRDDIYYCTNAEALL